MLSAFVIAQLVFDVAVVAFAVVYLLMKQPPRVADAPEPPEWYAHFLKLAQDLMAATEPVLERLESRPFNMGGSGRPPTLRAGNESRPSATAVWSTPNHDKYEKARGLLRSGAQPEEVAGHVGLSPAEMRLLTKVVAAETRPRSS